MCIRDRNKTDEKTLFIDASNNFVSGKNQNRLGNAKDDGEDNDHIGRILNTYRERDPKGVEKYAALVTQKDMAENDYNLNIPRYVDTFEEEAEIDLMAVRKDRERLKAELAALEVQMDGYLKELGYDV